MSQLLEPGGRVGAVFQQGCESKISRGSDCEFPLGRQGASPKEQACSVTPKALTSSVFLETEQEGKMGNPIVAADGGVKNSPAGLE